MYEPSAERELRHTRQIKDKILNSFFALVFTGETNLQQSHMHKTSVRKSRIKFGNTETNCTYYLYKMYIR